MAVRATIATLRLFTDGSFGSAREERYGTRAARPMRLARRVEVGLAPRPGSGLVVFVRVDDRHAGRLVEGVLRRPRRLVEVALGERLPVVRVLQPVEPAADAVPALVRQRRAHVGGGVDRTVGQRGGLLAAGGAEVAGGGVAPVGAVPVRGCTRRRLEGFVRLRRRWLGGRLGRR